MIYVPASLRLGEDDPNRNFFSSSIRDREKSSYDYKTLFFDAVRVEGSDSVRLFAPPMLNLLSELGQPKFTMNGIELDYTRNLVALGRFEEWELSGKSVSPEHHRLDIHFANTREFSLDINPIIPFPNRTRILTAIQKDNRLEWIRDWYAYYRNQFDVDHLVLYDNGSYNLSELTNSLPESATVVKWSFPYGPSISHDNKFTQIGALNHCRNTFGKNSMIFSFDIDEILVDPVGKVRKTIENRSVHYFPSYYVPVTGKLDDRYTFGSFTHRQVNVQLTGQKYIYDAERSTGVLPHYVHSHRIRLIDDIAVLLQKAINATRWKNNQKDTWKVAVLKLFLCFFVLGKRHRNYTVEDGYFLHFRGITTNWKKRGNRLNLVEEKKLVKDRALDFFRK